MRSWNDTERQKHSEAIRQAIQRKHEHRAIESIVPSRPTLPEPLCRHMLQQTEEAITEHRQKVRTHQALLREAERHREKLIAQVKWYERFGATKA